MASGIRLGSDLAGEVGSPGTAAIVGPSAAIGELRAQDAGSGARVIPTSAPGPDTPSRRAAEARSRTRAGRPLASTNSPSSPGPSSENAPTHRTARGVPTVPSAAPDRHAGRASGRQPERRQSVRRGPQLEVAEAVDPPDLGRRLRRPHVGRCPYGRRTTFQPHQRPGVDLRSEPCRVATRHQVGGGGSEDVPTVEGGPGRGSGGGARSAVRRGGWAQGHGPGHRTERPGGGDEEAVVRSDQPARSGAGGDAHRHGPAARPHAGVDHGQHHPPAQMGCTSLQQVGAALHVEGLHEVGQVDHRGRGRQPVEHRVHDTDELVGQSVVGEEVDPPGRPARRRGHRPGGTARLPPAPRWRRTVTAPAASSARWPRRPPR